MIAVIDEIGLTAVIFGLVTLALFLWSIKHGMLKILAAAILFAGWGVGLSGQIITAVDTPIEIYWAVDFTSAMAFFGLFLKFKENWLFTIATLFTGMVGLHWLYLPDNPIIPGGLHAYYHYWAITTLFAIQLLIVRVWHDRRTVHIEATGVGDIHKPDLSYSRRHHGKT